MEVENNRKNEVHYKDVMAYIGEEDLAYGRLKPA
jgi:hypothetical protein